RADHRPGRTPAAAGKDCSGKRRSRYNGAAQTIEFTTMNAPHSPSPLASVELAPRDPILGLTEAFLADEPKESEPRRRRLLRPRGQGAPARMRAPRRATARRAGRTARLPADRRPARLRPNGAAAGIRSGCPRPQGRA